MVVVVVVVVVVFEADDAASSFAVTSHMALRNNLIILDDSIYCEAKENGTVQATSESNGLNESSHSAMFNAMPRCKKDIRHPVVRFGVIRDADVKHSMSLCATVHTLQ